MAVQRVAKRHVRLTDLRAGQREPYSRYLAEICQCGHPNAHPPCRNCEHAIDEEQFDAEYTQYRKMGLSYRGAIYSIVCDHHPEDLYDD